MKQHRNAVKRGGIFRQRLQAPLVAPKNFFGRRKNLRLARRVHAKEPPSVNLPFDSLRRRRNFGQPCFWRGRIDAHSREAEIEQQDARQAPLRPAARTPHHHGKQGGQYQHGRDMRKRLLQALRHHRVGRMPEKESLEGVGERRKRRETCGKQRGGYRARGQNAAENRSCVRFIKNHFGGMAD